MTFIGPDPTTLQPGDCLIYRPASVFGWLIAVKGGHKFSHVELFAGKSFQYGQMYRSIASRDGEGVNNYPFSPDNLGRVLRPKPRTFDFKQAYRWFETVCGQKYDWLGLLCFTLAVKQGAQDRMFCSEFALRCYRAGGLEPFSEQTDPDHLFPYEFDTSAKLFPVWSDGQN